MKIPTCSQCVRSQQPAASRQHRKQRGIRPQPKKPGKLIAKAHPRLVKALAGSGAKAKPAIAARAQAMYECWTQEQEENNQQDHIDRCRVQFFIALAQIEKKAAAKPAKKKGKLSPLTFLVYFCFNSSSLDARANSVLGTASDVIKETKPKVVSVTGHTDRSGAGTYNAKLAEKRANAVAAALADDVRLARRKRQCRQHEGRHEGIGQSPGRSNRSLLSLTA